MHKGYPLKQGEHEEYHDHILSDDEIRVIDGKYLNSQTKLPGKKPKIDPKVQKLAQRDMELAMKQRERLEHQRKTEKEWSRDRFARPKTAVKKSKNPYKNVESKIKTSVVQDRSRYVGKVSFLLGQEEKVLER